MTKVIDILIVDDHAVLRQGVAQVLESQKDMHVVAQAASGEEALKLVRSHNPDVILMDIKMPDMDGVEATRLILSENPNANILILTMYRQDEYVFKAIQAGAKGYLLKEAEMDDLLSAVRRVADGESVIDSSLTSRVFAKLRGEIFQQASGGLDLAERDLEILKLVAKGLSNQDISEKVFVSEKTVRNRLSMIFKQHKLKNRTEAALFAMKHGLVDKDTSE